MLKVYGIHNRTAAIIKIPFNNGKGAIECEFENGLIGLGQMNEPAKYSTSSKFVQDIIENSPLFGSLIQLVRSYGEETPAAAPAAAVNAAAAAAQVNANRLAAARAAKAAKAANKNAVEEAPAATPAQADEQGGATQYQGGAATAGAVRDAGLEKGTEASAPVGEDHPEITTREDAVAFLKSRGATATNLASDEAILSYAHSIGVTFSNLEI